MEAAQVHDEELPLLERQQPTRPRKSWKPSCFVIVAVCLLFLQLSWLVSSFFRQDRNSVRYAGEHIAWNWCGDLKGRPLECSSIDVPMDQFDSENSGNKTFNVPLVRLRGRNATQNLLLNPGGPGVGGFWMLQWRGEEIKAIVSEEFHLLAFNPRGVNSSTPLATCYPDPKAMEQLSDARSSKDTDNPELYAWTQNFVQACRDTTGEHGLYVNTPQTAADLNSILDAVGQKDMFYWGFSYGTLLGQTYATMFPDRAKRMIIDGVANQFMWYESHIDWEALADTDRVLHGFYGECLKAGPGNCTLASLADSKEKLADLVDSKLEEIKMQPVAVYVNNTVYGVLTFEKLWLNGVFPALYFPESWYGLANNLAQLLKGNATDAYLAYGQRKAWQLEGDANRFVMMNDGLSGPEYWAQDRESLVEELTPLMNQSSFSPSSLQIHYTKQQWLYPRTHLYKPRKGVKTAEPMLILSTSFDPICPLVSAESANEAFEGSKMVEVQGYGHCSMAVEATCARQHVQNFLFDGRLPEQKHTLCQVDSSYFVRSLEDGRT